MVQVPAWRALRGEAMAREAKMAAAVMVVNCMIGVRNALLVKIGDRLVEKWCDEVTRL